MLYCGACNRLVSGNACPVCGRTALHTPRQEDYCFVTEMEMLWSQPLSDLFRDNGILFLTRNVRGAGMTARLGIATEQVRFFVPYWQYDRAKELEEAFFSAEFVEE